MFSASKATTHPAQGSQGVFLCTKQNSSSAFQAKDLILASASLVTAVIFDQQLASLRVCQRYTVLIGYNSIDKHHALDTVILFIKRLFDIGVTQPVIDRDADHKTQ